MPSGSRSISRLLERHRVTLSREVESANVLQTLVKKGVISLEEERRLASERNVVVRGDILAEIFEQKGSNAFRELCVTLENESPHLLTSLVLDSDDGYVGEGAQTSSALMIMHSRENSNVSQILPVSPKFNNRDLELNRSPSAGSLSGVLYARNGNDEKVMDKNIMDNLHELLEEPVEETGGERIAWEFHHVQLCRVPGYGFGIAVSGGRDNPHFTNGDPSIAISDVLKAGPAEGKLQINDRVISANSISLEGVDYSTAVQVLRDSGQTVNLVVKRRVVLPSSAPVHPTAALTATTATNNTNTLEAHDLKFSITRHRKKEDFGIVLGCKIYIKEIVRRSVADKEGGLREGDFVRKINNTSLEGLTLKEARKLIETSKDKLSLSVRRQDGLKTLPRSKQHAISADLSHVNGVAAPATNGDLKSGNYARPFPPSDAPTPPRPPLPVAAVDDGTDSSRTIPCEDRMHENSNTSITEEPDYVTNPQYASRSDTNGGKLPDPRFISFKKSGSVGIRLTGGNEVGIFVTAVQPGSPAAQQGLQPGDKILKVNDMDMKGVTREEAVLFLLSLQDQINLIAQYRRDEYDQIVQLQRGDSFYIKAHFNYESPENGEMAFKKSDVFHVVDTLHNGVVGAWQVFKIDPQLGNATDQVQKGVIPNKARAEEFATQQFNAIKKEQISAENTKTSFFRRKREKSRTRSKSLGKDHWEDLVWSESLSKFPAYERVSLKHPGFPRPVVIFGPVSDMARENLSRDYPAKFASPQIDGDSEDVKASKSGIVRLSAIRTRMDRGYHALLDVTPNAVDKLNYAQFYPIVIFAKTDSKQTIKECRNGQPKKAHLSSKKLLEQCQKLEKLWGHIFTFTMDLAPDNWYTKLVDLIDKQQTAPIWMSETKPEESLSDDFLFPMSSSRLSYTSSPESDGEFCDTETPRASRTQLSNLNDDHNSLSNGQLPRSTSDPSLVPKHPKGIVKPEEDIPDYNAPPPYAVAQQKHDGVGDTNYGFSGSKRYHLQQPSVSESVDELPLPPPPPGHAAMQSDRYGKSPKTPNGDVSPSKRSTSQPPTRISPPKNGVGEAPKVPPKIDRQKKPSRRSGSSGYGHLNSIATGGGEGMYGVKSSSLDRHSHLRDTKLSAYDGGNPIYDTNSMDAVDDGVGGGVSRPRSLNGPYSLVDNGSNSSSGNRQSRAISQESGYRIGGGGGGVKNGYGYAPSPGQTSNSSEKYRHSDYKPVPPPKSGPYKPVPPPKPKSYPRSQVSSSQASHVESNYMNSGPPPPPASLTTTNGHHSHNGNTDYSPYYNGKMNGHGNGGNRYQQQDNSSSSYHSTPNGRHEEDSNGFDSGQGSSLDREFPNGYPMNGVSDRYANPPGNNNNSRGQYYYNLPHHHQQVDSPKKSGDGLDLSNREYRGSAFELYKKPMQLQQQSSYNMEHC